MFHSLTKLLCSDKSLNATKAKPEDDRDPGEHLNADGTKVDYAGMKSSPRFTELAKSVVSLHLMDLSKLSDASKKALLLNLYNVCLIHGYVVEGVPGNTISRIKFYTELGYYVGPHFYSLNDIEHGLLRGKSPGISFLMCSGNGVNPVTGAPQFDKGDPRLAFICELDPRIHFALVCGAKSCPPIRIFTEENLEEALEMAGSAFCTNNITLVNPNTISLSKIFEWYMKDFGGSPRKVAEYGLKYLAKEAQEKIGVALASSKLNFVFAEYNWELNE